MLPEKILSIKVFGRGRHSYVWALGTLGAEAIWLLHGPDNPTLRRLLWDPRFEKIRLALEEQDRNERMKTLPDEQRARVERLVARQQDINRLASQNPSFTGDLLRGELIKTRKLVDSFLEMALTCARYEVTRIERDLFRGCMRWGQTFSFLAHPKKEGLTPCLRRELVDGMPSRGYIA